jgi:hypothetical protein
MKCRNPSTFRITQALGPYQWWSWASVRRNRVQAYSSVVVQVQSTSVLMESTSCKRITRLEQDTAELQARELPRYGIVHQRNENDVIPTSLHRFQSAWWFPRDCALVWLIEIYEMQRHILEAQGICTLDQEEQYLRDHAKDCDSSRGAEWSRNESANVEEEWLQLLQRWNFMSWKTHSRERCPKSPQYLAIQSPPTIELLLMVRWMQIFTVHTAQVLR